VQPGTSGSLESINARVRRWVEDHDGGLVCPICRHSDFGGTLISAVLDSRGRSSLGPGEQLVQLTCANCANVLHFDANRIGIHPDNRVRFDQPGGRDKHVREGRSAGFPRASFAGRHGTGG
jgi:hypothetical protein